MFFCSCKRAFFEVTKNGCTLPYLRDKKSRLTIISLGLTLMFTARRLFGRHFEENRRGILFLHYILIHFNVLCKVLCKDFTNI